MQLLVFHMAVTLSQHFVKLQTHKLQLQCKVNTRSVIIINKINNRLTIMHFSSWDKLCFNHIALKSNRATAEHSNINIKMAWGTRASTQELFCHHFQDSLSHLTLTSPFCLGWTVVRAQNPAGAMLPALPVPHTAMSWALKRHQPIPAHSQRGCTCFWFQQDGNCTWFLCPWASCTAFSSSVLCSFWLRHCCLAFPHTHERIFPIPLLPAFTLPSPFSFLAAVLWHTSQRNLTAPPVPACPACLEAPQANSAFAAGLIWAPSCSVHGKLGRERICWGQEQLCANTNSFPRQSRVTGEVPADTKEQQCARSMALLSPGERMALVFRRCLALFAPCQSMGEKLGAGVQHQLLTLHRDWEQPQPYKVRETTHTKSFLCSPLREHEILEH